MVKYGFKEHDMFGVIEWAIQTYDRWLIDRTECVDIDKLLFYIKSASVVTGNLILRDCEIFDSDIQKPIKILAIQWHHFEALF